MICVHLPRNFEHLLRCNQQFGSDRHNHRRVDRCPRERRNNLADCPKHERDAASAIGQRSQRSKETNEYRCRPDSGYSGDSATHLRRMSDPMKQILAVVVVAVVVDAKTNAIKPVTNSAMAISFNTAQLIHSTPMVLRN